MQKPSWAVNTSKYIRAKDAVKSGSVNDIKEEYIRIGGLVNESGWVDNETPADEPLNVVDTVTEVTADAPKKVKKAKK